MATASAVFPRHVQATRARARRKPRLAKFPFENFILFGLALAFYIVIANFLVFRMHYMIDDAYARTDNAFDVLFTSDPHLGGIGFFWPPLPSFLQLPFLAFNGVWPALVGHGFAGSIEAAAFSAGTAVLINSGLRWAGVVRAMRWVFCLIWVVNPMTIIYAAQGMSEAMFVFFFTGSILVFLRWSENRRTSLLPLLGVLAGGGCLCRNEAFAVAFLLGVGVTVQAVRNGGRWREVETELLLYALPAVFVTMLWIGSMAIIMHDPIYWLHANGLGSPSQAAASVPAAGPAIAHPIAPPDPNAGTNRLSAYGLIRFDTYREAATFILGHSLALFPAVVLFIGLVGARLLIKAKRLSGIVLLVLGASIPALDIFLIRGGLAPDIRYQIAIIPFTFLMAIYVLRSLGGRRGAILSTLTALAMVPALAVSTLLTAQTLSNPTLAPQEAPLYAALVAGKNVPEATGQRNKIDIGAEVTPKILALDKDTGRILCDSTTCFPVILNAPNPKQFIVTSDEVFEGAAGQPQVYGVEYFLVPPPTGQAAYDRLNVLYPTLWKDGAGFSQLVGSVTGDPMGEWRLYRITGPTGRG